jgi:hypothetical protein
VGFGLIDYGRGSVNFLLNNNIRGPIFNDFNLGGYLTYRIYPRKVFIDNRPEAYPKQFFEDVYLPMQKSPEIFQQLDKKNNFNTIIVSHYDGTNYKNQLLRYFVSNSKFTLVYLDSYAMVFVKNNPTNLRLIGKYKIEKDFLKFDKVTDRQVLLRYFLLFEKIGWTDQGQRVLGSLQSL